MAANGRAPRGDLVRAAVLGLLGTRGPSSRADIARMLEVSPATVTQTTKELLARQLIVELESVPSAGGRPARLLGLVRSAGKALGVKVTPNHLAAVLVGLDGTILHSEVLPFDSSQPTAVDALATLIAGIAGEYVGELLGIGIGIPGSVDAPGVGTVDAPTLGWMNAPVGQRMRERGGLPVLVDNDVNTLAAAEILYGIGRRHSSYLVVTIGLGVGCALVQDGSVMRGAHGGAGEIGHIPVADKGPKCGCGNEGCLEAFIGEAGLVAQARLGKVIGPGGTFTGLVRAARAGDAQALEIFKEAGALLGRVVAGLVHTVDPETVVVMGEGVTDWDLWDAGFEAAFRRHLMPTRRGVPFVVEPWTEGQWAVGAASLVLASPFDSTGAAGSQGELVRARMQAPAAKAGLR